MKLRKWLRGLLIAGLMLFGVSFGISRALRASAARRYLIAQLAASFGRPVEVSWFDFSLLDGARIGAHFVSVADDPHFGNEYFLRADTLTAGLRWSSLLAGRFEFGSVSLARPSLNLVRDAHGEWNIERWLPPVSVPGSRPGFVGPLAPSRDVRAARLNRMAVDGGRINFKQGDDKFPFALADVSGRVEQDGAGRWQLDLEARPIRAGVELQDIGTIRLRGRVSGTTARLQPAELNFTWRAASLADALRLVRQNDYGARGRLSVDLNARVTPPEAGATPRTNSGGAQWSISGTARLTGLHGWRLPERNTDPATNLSLDVDWRLGTPRVEIRKVLVEAPASRLQGVGEVDWSHGVHPRLHIESSTLALADILSWYRALRPDVPEDLRAEGTLGLNLTADGWPLQFQRGSIASAGARLTGKSLPASLQIGPLNASVSRGALDFAAAEISFAPAPAVAAREPDEADRLGRQSFILRGAALPEANGTFRWPPNWNVSIEGATSRMQDWLALSAALGQRVNAGWAASGGAAAKLRAAHRRESPATAWLGTVDFLGLSVSPAYINQPLSFPKARVEFAPLQRTITLTAAEAFGAVWHGSISRKDLEQQWTFDLSADRLDVAELDRWLGPRARPPGFLARLAGLESQAAAAVPPDAIITRIAAHGRLRAGEIDLAPLHLERFDGEAEVAGRTIQVRKGRADFFGGKVSGSFDAQLEGYPSYEFRGQFERVNLAQLGREVAFLNDRFAGNVSASLILSAHGIGRADLLSSMEGRGTLNGRNIDLRGLDLSPVFPGTVPDVPSSQFSSIQGSYRIHARGIELANFVLDHSKGPLEAEGRIDFSQSLNIRIHPSIFQAAMTGASVSPPSFALGGTIENPRLALPSPPGHQAAQVGARGR